MNVRSVSLLGTPVCVAALAFALPSVSTNKGWSTPGWVLPGSGGTLVPERLSSHTRSGELPAVVLTSSGDHGAYVEL
jgi:hypothetical protein